MSLNLGSTVVQSVHDNRTLKLNNVAAIENAIGGSGADVFIGNSLNNTLTGNAGDDSLRGLTGNDIMIGGLHDDLYIFGDAPTAEADQVTEYANQGTDSLILNVSAGITLHLGSNAVQTVHTNRTLKLNLSDTFESADGGSGEDVLTGNSLNNTLVGNEGNDVLIGNGGDDRLLGDSGRDILIGGFGADDMNGGIDDDILISGWRFVDTRMNSADVAAIKSVLTVWASSVAYEFRIQLLKGAGQSSATITLKPGIDIRNDLNEVDNLAGYIGTDWFICGSVDKVPDLLSETKDLL